MTKGEKMLRAAIEQLAKEDHKTDCGCRAKPQIWRGIKPALKLIEVIEMED